MDDNGFNPMWGENLTLPFRCAQDMLDLVFVKFDVRREGTVVDSMDQSIGSYCVSLGSMNQGQSRLGFLFFDIVFERRSFETMQAIDMFRCLTSN